MLPFSSLPPNHRALPHVFWLRSHPDMLQVFAVDRIEDAVGSHQLHSTLYVDINYSSTLAVLKTKEKMCLSPREGPTYTSIWSACTLEVDTSKLSRINPFSPFRPSF